MFLYTLPAVLLLGGYVCSGYNVRCDGEPCDLSKAVLPTAPTPLPPPGAGLELVHVAIGKGTQNYTCTNNSSQAKPVAVGALANLYDISCLAANNAEILPQLPNIILLQVNQSDSLKVELSGHHYFRDTTSAVFDMAARGLFLGTKVASSLPPPDALKGQYNEGFGSVPWLKLSAGNSSVKLVEVYRVETAGGNPPTTCENQQKFFEVPYTAQ